MTYVSEFLIERQLFNRSQASLNCTPIRTFTTTAIKIRYADEYGDEDEEDDESAMVDITSDPPTFPLPRSGERERDRGREREEMEVVSMDRKRGYASGGASTSSTWLT